MLTEQPVVNSCRRSVILGAAGALLSGCAIRHAPGRLMSPVASASTARAILVLRVLLTARENLTIGLQNFWFLQLEKSEAPEAKIRIPIGLGMNFMVIELDEGQYFIQGLFLGLKLSRESLEGVKFPSSATRFAVARGRASYFGDVEIEVVPAAGSWAGPTTLTARVNSEAVRKTYRLAYPLLEPTHPFSVIPTELTQFYQPIFTQSRLTATRWQDE